MRVISLGWLVAALVVMGCDGDEEAPPANGPSEEVEDVTSPSGDDVEGDGEAGPGGDGDVAGDGDVEETWVPDLTPGPPEIEDLEDPHEYTREIEVLDAVFEDHDALFLEVALADCRCDPEVESLNECLQNAYNIWTVPAEERICRRVAADAFYSEVKQYHGCREDQQRQLLGCYDACEGSTRQSLDLCLANTSAAQEVRCLDFLSAEAQAAMLDIYDCIEDFGE